MAAWRSSITAAGRQDLKAVYRSNARVLGRESSMSYQQKSLSICPFLCHSIGHLLNKLVIQKSGAMFRLQSNLAPLFHCLI